MYGYGESFRKKKATFDVIRYEEVERLTHKVLALGDDDGEWYDMYAKHEDRLLTQKEVWEKAIETCALLLDERLGQLCQD